MENFTVGIDVIARGNGEHQMQEYTMPNSGFLNGLASSNNCTCAIFLRVGAYRSDGTMFALQNSRSAVRTWQVASTGFIPVIKGQKLGIQVAFDDVTAGQKTDCDYAYYLYH